MMTVFIFVGDMLVMLFMVVLVIWVFMVTPDSEIEEAAMIPLRDEDPENPSLPNKEVNKEVNKKAGVHG